MLPVCWAPRPAWYALSSGVSCVEVWGPVTSEHRKLRQKDLELRDVRWTYIVVSHLKRQSLLSALPGIQCLNKPELQVDNATLGPGSCVIPCAFLNFQMLSNAFQWSDLKEICDLQ